MVKLHDGQFLLSPSDITAASGCEYGWLAMKVDPALGRRPKPQDEDDFLERVSRLGDAHEERVLRDFTAELGADRVVELERARGWNPASISDGVRQAVEALRGDADVVFQALLHDGALGGYADFLLRQEDGRWQVVDTKLARHARVTALLQIAAYADLLDGLGVPRSSEGMLWLGDDTQVTADLDEIIPVYRRRRARLEAVLAEHQAAESPVAWGRDGLSICGQCEACTEAIAETVDVLQIAGATRLQRGRARAAGITTVAGFAASEEPPAGMARRTWEGLRAQARMQLEPAREDGRPPFEIVDRTAVDLLPAPDAGDIFFDFEGDPLWSAPNGRMEGLEYLFGWVAPVPGRATAETGFDEFEFIPLWAHSRAEEKAALEQFAAYVEARRAEHPGMRIYHYAPYEVTALKRLTVRHGVHEGTLDGWLRAGLFVDLYSTVRSALRAGVPSYSIKKLEPLYMGQDHRSEDGVTTAADSVNEYHRWSLLHEDGLAGDAAKAAEAEQVLAGIGDYNRYDCVSTVRLRDWLLAEVAELDERGRGAEVGSGAEVPEESQADALPTAEPEQAPDAPTAPDESVALEHDLLDLLPTEVDPATGVRVPVAQLSDEDRGIALLAAALGFYQREEKPMWWAFFDRLQSPPDEWQNPRANCVADVVELVEDWHRPPRARTEQRVLQLRGTLEPGTELSEGAKAKPVYEDLPPGAELQPNAERWIGTNAEVEQIEDLPDGTSLITLRERFSASPSPQNPQPAPPHELPMAIFAHDVVQTGALQVRILEHAEATRSLGRLPGPGSSPVFDVLARRSPATSGRTIAEISAEARCTTHKWPLLVEAIESARGSYVAVQGPPGTGKTHVGSHAVKALAERGWRIGVTAQSHAVVENFLQKLADIGLPKESIGKVPTRLRSVLPDDPWVAVGVDDADQHLAEGGVIGGTAWAFAKDGHPPLDLLVIDEAGQFSLAHTLAASAVADTLLLLGDPQQLPQVTKGTHPQPIGDAALDWLMEGSPVLPEDRGFFLDTSWRMHSALSAPVSTLSYGGELGSQIDVTDSRHLAGVEPGLHVVPVEHHGNAVSSPEEAARVVELVRDVVGKQWTPKDGADPRPLEDTDVIVVAPYNAQVATVRAALDEAGFHDTTVGTVDKFQGREAAVAILTMAASSAENVPRGLDFLLNRNRLNVSISRGQWAAYLVHSPALGDALPTNPVDLPLIGAFLRLVDGTDVHTHTRVVGE